MTQTQSANVEVLLIQAGNAHHVYEQTVLKGAYDQEWANWYADYVIQHGLGDLLNQSVTTEQVSQFFSESYRMYEQKNTDQNWASYTAEKMIEERFRLNFDNNQD